MLKELSYGGGYLGGPDDVAEALHAMEAWRKLSAAITDEPDSSGCKE